MIIEFVGLMGAGKTTLHDRAVQRLAVTGRCFWTSTMIGESWTPVPLDAAYACDGTPWRVLSRFRRFVFKVKASWRSRHLVFIAAQRLLMSSRSLDDKLRGARRLLATVGNHWTARLVVPPDQIVLFQEGLAQRLITAFIDGDAKLDLAAVRRYARALPDADLLVYVRVDPDIAMARATRRTGDMSRRFKSLSRVELRCAFDDAAQALEALVAEVRRTAGRRMQVVLIDANDLERAKTEFDSHLAPFLQVC